MDSGTHNLQNLGPHPGFWSQHPQNSPEPMQDHPLGLTLPKTKQGSSRQIPYSPNPHQMPPTNLSPLSGPHLITFNKR